MIKKQCLVVLKGQMFYGPFSSVGDMDAWTSSHIEQPYSVVTLYPPLAQGTAEKAHECGAITQVPQTSNRS